MSDNVIQKEALTPRMWIYFAIIALFVIVSARAFVSDYFPKIVYSESESLEHSIFVVKQARGEIERGDFVSFRIPENPFIGQVKVTKMVMGVPGDTVSVDDRWIFINGEKIGRAKEKTRAGLDLQVIKPVVIPDGRYFVAGTHIDSYDSRYKSFGLIGTTQIAGIAEPIF